MNRKGGKFWIVINDIVSYLGGDTNMKSMEFQFIARNAIPTERILRSGKISNTPLPHDLTWDRTRSDVVGRRRLTIREKIRLL
jgi:hypothetical protein